MGRKRNSASTKTLSEEKSLVEEKPEALSAGWRIILSLAVLVQLLAVVAEPFQFFTRSSRGTSPAADPVRSWLAPYVEFAYLNHGYFFFAPEPGPSHLMDCRLTLSDDRQATLRFPDRDSQWPRLLYHRHFMMAENLHQLWAPPIDDRLVAADDPMRPFLAADRKRFEAVRDSMVRHLIHRYDAQAASIERVEHRLPSSNEVLVDRIRLNDKRLYVTLPDVPLEQDIRPLTSGVPPGVIGPSHGSLPPVGGQTLAEPVEVLP